MAEDIERVLFLFEKTEAVEQWQCVNDGVVGGRSGARVTISDRKHLEFFGNLALANNGGFASVRSSRIDLGRNGRSSRGAHGERL